jgi:hypothetical protein
MGISMAICETECKNALCREAKLNVLKVLVKDPSKYGDAAEFEITMAIEDVLKAFPDGDAFLKRNKIGSDVCTLYIERVKDANDLAVLEKIMKKNYTGWVDLSKVNASVKAELLNDTNAERQTDWDTLSFEEMAELCKKCTLSWDKGRGCLGSFGPDNGLLPGIAAKYNCVITASVPDGVAKKRIYTKDDASALVKEIPVLRDALVKEGKLAVSRYSGAVDRLEAVATISVNEGCGFKFF